MFRKPKPGHEPYKRPTREVFRMLPNLSWEAVKRMRQSRRNQLYIYFKKTKGWVPCYVCGLHVKAQDATLEHIKPLSRGGTDAWDNLAISHAHCNAERGNQT